MYSPRLICSYRYALSHYGPPAPETDMVEQLKRMQRLGFASAEIQIFGPEHFVAVEEQTSAIREYARANQLSLPYLATAFPALSSTDPKESQAALQMFGRACVVAEKLGARGIVDMAPLPPLEFPKNAAIHRKYDAGVLAVSPLKDNIDWFSHWENLLDGYRQACDMASTHNLTYSVHPTVGSMVSNTDAFLYLHEEIARNNLRFAMDTASQFLVRDNLILSLLRISDLIDLIYVSDNDGTHSEHLGPGEGSVRWDQFFDYLIKIRFKGHLAVDVGGINTSVDSIDSAYQITASMVETYLGI